MNRSYISWYPLSLANCAVVCTLPVGIVKCSLPKPGTFAATASPEQVNFLSAHIVLASVTCTELELK